MHRVAASFAAVLVPALAAAQEAPPPDTTVVVEAPRPWYDALSVNGFASIGFTFNANRPADESNQLRVFDGSEGTIAIDVVELVVQKPASSPGDAGFRIDLTAGSSLPHITASAGLFRDEDGNAEDFDLQQAFVSYIAPVGRGLRLDAGKFVTHAGYELIEGYDGYNDHYSRSILFGYAIPFTHTGAKLGYALSEQVSAMVMVANGWDNVKDNNFGKTAGAQLAFNAAPVTAWLNYVGGPEQAGSSNLRHVVDAIVALAATDTVTVALNADLGVESDVPDIGDALWAGAAVYGRYQATPRLSLGARAEVFHDRDGARTGTAQTLYEGTLTPAVKLGDNFVIRGDLRFDRSNEAMYMTDEGSAKQQITLALNAVGVL